MTLVQKTQTLTSRQAEIDNCGTLNLICTPTTTP